MRRKLLGELLIDQKLLTRDQLEECLSEQRTSKAPLGSIILEKGILSANKLMQVLAAQLGVSPWFPEQQPPQDLAVASVPPVLMQRYQAMPVAILDRTLVVAMRNPGDIDAIDAIRNITGMKIEPALADEVILSRLIESALARGDMAATGQKVPKVGGNFVDQAMGELAKSGKLKNDEAALTEAETRPVVGLINEIISTAVRRKASDVHIEPRENRVEVRYRIDGQLVPVMEFPVELMPMVTARIKIMAEIDVVEYRTPQDGRILVNIDQRRIDLRLSVLPNYFGPRIVMRVLDRNVALRKLDELGFSERNVDLFRRMIDRPYGLVLVTGPTGSGKTTTLYAALNELKTTANNIMTCEDPVEYAIDGINQSQVREKIGLTFATQLRAILRQDPDVVLVGEIRDHETAETAIRASMTGHLVLSTLHCNDAASAVPRLLDIGIDPFMLSSSLVGVVAQRLLRCLCPNCRVQGEADRETSEAMTAFGLYSSEPVWNAVGCSRCFNTGYSGRMGVHEVLPVPSEVASLVANRASGPQITELAYAYGFRTMHEEAIERVRAGETTFVEAKRLISFDNFVREGTSQESPLRLAS